MFIRIRTMRTLTKIRSLTRLHAMAAVCVAVATGSHSACAQTGFWLLPGRLPPPIDEVGVYRLSHDGSVGLGEETTSAGQRVYFQWDKANGRTDLTTPAGYRAFHYYDTSGDGQLLAGSSFDSSGRFSMAVVDRAQHVSTAPAPVAPYTDTEGYAMSPNGRYVGGVSYQPSVGDLAPTRWTVGGELTTYPIPSTHSSICYIYGVNDRGDMIGTAGSLNSGIRFGHVWHADGTVLRLTAPPQATYPDTEARAISADSSRVFGFVGIGNQIALTYWNADNRPTVLGFVPVMGLGDVQSCNEAGTLVMGQGERRNPTGLSDTWVWSEGQGFFELSDWLRRNGVNVPAGISMEAHAMSSDGLTFSGYARDANRTNFAFVATVPSSGTLALLCVAGLCAGRRRR